MEFFTDDHLVGQAGASFSPTEEIGRVMLSSGPFDIGQVLASGQEIDAVMVPLVVMVLTVLGI
jgi:hypothetical protein